VSRIVGVTRATVFFLDSTASRRRSPELEAPV
jgi:hypothetical protein